jgi:hypothetical protein
VEPLDGDEARVGRACEQRPARAKCGRAARGVDRIAGGGSGAQPAVWLRLSFIRHHERGFAVPASSFMRGLCHHYGVELHNFAPNAISQAATFVGVCEGFLGIPANWDLWVHLFRAELHTLTTPEPRGARRRHDDLAAGVAQGILHSLHDDLQQRRVRAGVVLPPQRRARPPPYTGKVLKEKADSWFHGVSPHSHQAWLDSLLTVLKSLADAGLGAASVLANLHHRRIIP